jgi:hypothetical protein
MDNAPGVRFVSFTFLAGFGFGAFIGVALALIAVAIARPEDEEPRVVTIPIAPTATSLPGETPPPSVRSTAALTVRVGPGDEYATLGTITRGDALDVVGRDFDSAWLAIRFPAGSSARGWIPAADVEGLTLPSLQALAVLLPTPLPIEFITPPAFFGTPGEAVTGTPGLEDGTPFPFPDSSDLALVGVQPMPDGRVTVSVLNFGPVDLVQDLIVVTVRDLGGRFETMTFIGDLTTGATISFTTSTFLVGAEYENVQVVVDPASNLDDPNRLNNVQTNLMSRDGLFVPTPAGPG